MRALSATGTSLLFSGAHHFAVAAVEALRALGLTPYLDEKSTRLDACSFPSDMRRRSSSTRASIDLFNFAVASLSNWSSRN